jgi:hypothetical protein
MERRGFLASFGTALGAAVLDPERALWVPGKKVISVPAPADGVHLRFDYDPCDLLSAGIIAAYEDREIVNCGWDYRGNRKRTWNVLVLPSNRREHKAAPNQRKQELLKLYAAGLRPARSPGEIQRISLGEIQRMPDFVQEALPYKFNPKHFSTRNVYEKAAREDFSDRHWNTPQPTFRKDGVVGCVFAV